MVESIAKLRKKCQQGRKMKGRSGEHWIVLKLYRRVSIYFTKFFLTLGVSANQASFLSFLCAVIAAVLFAAAFPIYSALGALFVFLCQVIDYSDGEIARYHGTAGKKGERVESALGHLDLPLYYIGMGFGAMRLTGRPEFLAAAAVSAVLLMKKQVIDETARVYLKKSFHQSAGDSIRRAFSSWKSALLFFAFSHFLLNFAFIAAGALFLPHAMTAVWLFLSVAGYIVYSHSFVKGGKILSKL